MNLHRHNAAIYQLDTHVGTETCGTFLFLSFGRIGVQPFMFRRCEVPLVRMRSYLSQLLVLGLLTIATQLSAADIWSSRSFTTDPARHAIALCESSANPRVRSFATFAAAAKMGNYSSGMPKDGPYSLCLCGKGLRAGQTRLLTIVDASQYN